MLTGLRRLTYDRLHGLSLTRRLVTVVVLLVLAAYLLTTSVTVMMMRGYLVNRADEDLTAYLQPLAQRALSQIDAETTGQPSPSSALLVPPNIPYFVVVTPADGGAARPFLTRDTDLSLPALASMPMDDPRIGAPFTVRSANGELSWRVLAGQQASGEGTVAVAVPLDGIESTVRQLAVLITVIGLVTLVLVAVLGWFAVRRAFRPLTRIEDTAAAIAGGDLTLRMPPGGADDEVSSLSASINAMLTQIEHSFGVREASERRMRDFVADASHELRTPLATVKGYAELYRFGAVRDPEDVAGAMRRIEGEATRMTKLVEDLLTLTRWDAEPRLSPTRVDLTVLASDVVQDARVRAGDRRLALVPLRPGSPPEGGRSGPPMVIGEDGALRQVLTNLVANAISYSPVDSPVEVALGRLGDEVVVEVRDHGPGLDPDSAERVFERFYRADKSRSRASGGTGLGLAIVAAIVARHGGGVRHLPTPGGGATFRVTLPAAPPPGPDDVEGEGEGDGDEAPARPANS
ncbi:sensor histidine kinase [Ornithinimicrobium flavum]|uniref:sensor histidine kinase n=1 Tax=Ornithinimicrobium flavum TaxID=1288636 RepID=UPI00107054DC|nr:HAMP domain-containing sensor histidine kinase [Ornithinimicrobium flavum]